MPEKLTKFKFLDGMGAFSFFFCGFIETHIYENFISYVCNYAFYKRVHVLLRGGRKCLAGQARGN